MRALLVVAFGLCILFLPTYGAYRLITDQVWYFLPLGRFSGPDIKPYQPEAWGLDGSAFECMREREKFLSRYPTTKPTCLPVPLFRHLINKALP